jgi:hypothetical protein
MPGEIEEEIKDPSEQVGQGHRIVIRRRSRSPESRQGTSHNPNGAQMAQDSKMVTREL